MIDNDKLKLGSKMFKPEMAKTATAMAGTKHRSSLRTRGFQ